MSRKIPKMEIADALKCDEKAKPQTDVQRTKSLIERKNLIVHCKIILEISPFDRGLGWWNVQSDCAREIENANQTWLNQRTAQTNHT